MTLHCELCSKLILCKISLYYEKLTRSDLLRTWVGDHHEESVYYILESKKNKKHQESLLQKNNNFNMNMKTK